jgi:type IV pilus assembly protein PilC
MELFSSLGYLDKVFFTKHLSMFLRSGIPMNEALAALSEERKGGAMSRIAQSIQAEVENGQTLSKALAKNPGSFDIFYVSIVEIGEISGTLEKSLDYLAGKLSREEKLRKKIKGMLYYPAVVVASSVAVSGFISFFVLPRLGGMFESFDVKLPLPTRILLFVANGIKNHGIMAVVVFFVLAFLTRFFVMISPNFKLVWHRIKFRVPIFGRVIKNATLSAFFRNLGIMLSSGLTIESALINESNMSENLVMRRAADNLARSIAQGQNIGESVSKDEEGIFSPLCARMIRAGEVSGELEESLIYLADFFEDEAQTQAKNAAVIFEPILMLVIAAIVGFIAISIILPIYSLTGSIHY